MHVKHNGVAIKIGVAVEFKARTDCLEFEVNKNFCGFDLEHCFWRTWKKTYSTEYNE